MNSIIVVDDEPIIVNGIVQLLREHFPELDIYAAYHAGEALDRMSRTKVDLVLTDVRMPGMDGLALQTRIVEKWPRCKVVFLTGYDDFDYIRQAVRNGVLDYLLKTEGEAAIVQAVRKAIDEYAKEFDADALLKQARDQLMLARASLHKDVLSGILNGDVDSEAAIAKQFAELDMGLDSKEPVLLALARLDEWQDERDTAGRTLLIYALQNIAEEYLSPKVRSRSVMLDKHRLVWCIQLPEGARDPKSWQEAISFVHGILQNIQAACSALLRRHVSFAAAREPVAWREAGRKLGALRLLFTFGLGLGKEILLIEPPAAQPEAGSPDFPSQQLRIGRGRIDELGMLLETGRRELFFDLFRETYETFFLSGEWEDRFKLEIYYALVTLFLSYLNRTGGADELEEKLPLSRLLRMDTGVSWEEAFGLFGLFAAELFERLERGARSRESELVGTVQAFVVRHLSGDLSLTRIADEVSLSPPYLSKLYKQITGTGLSDYINGIRLAKAKALLREESRRIQEVAAAVGFDADPSYFYRFFKRHMQMTPQEYRDQARRATNDSLS